MAKKTSRQISKVSTSTNGAATVSQTPRATFSSRYTEASTVPDYPYVKKDLRRIGILAGSMFAGMIVLALILPFIVPLYAH